MENTQNTQQKICNCGNQMEQISGNRKLDGKPYSGWKCYQCGNYEPIRQQGSYQGGYSKPKTDWDAINKQKEGAIRQNMEMKAEGQAKGAAFNKACDVAIALYQGKDITIEMIIPKIKEIFAELKLINQENGK